MLYFTKIKKLVEYLGLRYNEYYNEFQCDPDKNSGITKLYNNQVEILDRLASLEKKLGVRYINQTERVQEHKDWAYSSYGGGTIGDYIKSKGLTKRKKSKKAKKAKK